MPCHATRRPSRCRRRAISTSIAAYRRGSCTARTTTSSHAFSDTVLRWRSIHQATGWNQNTARLTRARHATRGSLRVTWARSWSRTISRTPAPHCGHDEGTITRGARTPTTTGEMMRGDSNTCRSPATGTPLPARRCATHAPASSRRRRMHATTSQAITVHSRHVDARAAGGT